MATPKSGSKDCFPIWSLNKHLTVYLQTSLARYISEEHVGYSFVLSIKDMHAFKADQ